MRQILGLLLLCLFPSIANAQWTAITGAGNSEDGSASTIAVTLGASINAGDTVDICAYQGGNGAATINSVSDGTSSLTALTAVINGNNVMRRFYILQSVASGTPTYTVTYSTAVTIRRIRVRVHRATGTPSVETSNQSSGNGTTISSGNISPSGTNSLFVLGCGRGQGGGTLSTHEINGVTADSVYTASGGLQHWARHNISGFTDGAATATLSINLWTGSVVAYKDSSAPAASAGLCRFFTLLGVGGAC